MYLRHRQVDALVGAQLAADDHTAINVGRNNSFNAQFDIPVREENRMPDLHFVRQALQRNRRTISVARHDVGSQDEFLPRLQLDNTACNIADPDLRTLQVLKNGNWFVESLANTLNLADEIPLIFRRAMGEVEARDIHAGGDELCDHFFAVGGRTDGANNLGAPDHLESFFAFSRSSVALRSGAS